MNIEFKINKDSLIGSDMYSVTFGISEITDEEIISIVKFSPIEINFDPGAIGITHKGYTGAYGVLHGPTTYKFSLHPTEDEIINMADIYTMNFIFKDLGDAEKFKKFIERQFENEIHRIKGIKKIYEGAEKVLDKSSKDYQEIVEKNRTAWKKLADL